MAARVMAWLDERTGLLTIWNTVFDRKVPKVNWWFTLGSASLFLAVMQGATGIFLTVYYVPTPEDAYKSIEYIMNDVAFGWLVRGIHHWGASLMVVIVFLHLLRVFIYGAYKYPREVTWMTGVVLLLATLGSGFTGYLLPWNQQSYWATVVGTSIVGTVPVVGEFLLRVLRAGEDLTFLTLSRFFAAHIWILPAILFSVIGVHLYLVIRNGISYVPRRDE
ncbi:MAG: cytochrome b N-terminal domain-containing protein [Ardenticatenia bacterium]|nr:cytochrome b N-terminal domain-containing protein [Ardenticatenia bacterium]